ETPRTEYAGVDSFGQFTLNVDTERFLPLLETSCSGVADHVVDDLASQLLLSGIAQFSLSPGAARRAFVVQAVTDLSLHRTYECGIHAHATTSSGMPGSATVRERALRNNSVLPRRPAGSSPDSSLWRARASHGIGRAVDNG